MDFSLKHLAAATLMVASLSSFTSAAHANITPQQNAVILKTFSDTSVKDFRQFLTSLAKRDIAKTDDLGTAISAFLDNKTLSPEQQNLDIAPAWPLHTGEIPQRGYANPA